MTVHFYQGQSYSWCYSNRSYDDNGCWEDYLSADEYDEWLDRKRFEQSKRDRQPIGWLSTKLPYAPDRVYITQVIKKTTK